jgi:hypothetical protein
MATILVIEEMEECWNLRVLKSYAVCGLPGSKLRL